jgi:hypothetical protein
MLCLVAASTDRARDKYQIIKICFMKKIMIISTFAAFIFLGISCGNKTAKTEAATGTEQSATDGYYTCPMHPEIQENKPGNCPKCGMTLVLKKAATRDTLQMNTSTRSKE